MTKEQIINILKSVYSEADELYKRSELDCCDKDSVRSNSFSIMEYAKQVTKELGYEIDEETDGYVGYF